MNTMVKARTAPAVPTIHGIRMKRMTPKMFWMHGRNTPSRVPSLATGLDFLASSSSAEGMVAL